MDKPCAYLFAQLYAVDCAADVDILDISTA